MAEKHKTQSRRELSNNHCSHGMTWNVESLLKSNNFFSGLRDAGYDEDDDHTYTLLATAQESCMALGSAIGGPLAGTITQSLSFEWSTTFCSCTCAAMVNTQCNPYESMFVKPLPSQRLNKINSIIACLDTVNMLCAHRNIMFQATNAYTHLKPGILINLEHDLVLIRAAVSSKN